MDQSTPHTPAPPHDNHLAGAFHRPCAVLCCAVLCCAVLCCVSCFAFCLAAYTEHRSCQLPLLTLACTRMHAFISIVCIVVVVVVCQILNVGILTLLDRRIPEEKIQDHFLADPAVLAGVIIMVVFQTIHMIVVVISSIKLAKQVCCVCLRVRVCLCVCVLVRACACVCMCACGVYFDACASCFLTCCLCLGLRGPLPSVEQ